MIHLMNIFSGWDSHALEKKKLGLPFDFKLVARHGYFVWHDLFHNLSGLRTFRSILLTSLRRKVCCGEISYHVEVHFFRWPY